MIKQQKHKFKVVSIDNSDINPAYTDCFTAIFIKVGFIIGLLLVLLQISRGSSFLFFTFLSIGLYFYIRYKKNQNRKLEKRLKQLIIHNQLFTERSLETVDDKGFVKKERQLINAVYLAYLITDEYIIIRAKKRGDLFSKKVSDLDVELSATIQRPLYNKIDKVTHTDYYFKKESEKRLEVGTTDTEECLDPFSIPLSTSYTWNVKSQPHLLLAGITG
ncbi:hypothetical protein [Acetoanaerobium noterae]|uniref:hypothetical protein n=1 Tax=Acetoanaerobium noterae TaxID=745369 RepID=UPI003221D21E